MSSITVLIVVLLLVFVDTTNAITPPPKGISGKKNTLKNDIINARKIVIGVDGGTESIRACCFDAETGEVVRDSSFACPYETYHPRPGWAEQYPKDWWDGLGKAVRGCLRLAKLKEGKEELVGLCIDTTCCSVVALDENFEPKNPCLLWMDQRSAEQTRRILELARNDPALEVNCNGKGPISAEWMTPKALWMKEQNAENWDDTKYICEYQDYINYKLTGVFCASSCNAAARWHWDGKECLKEGEGRPTSLYRKLGIPELADKLPQTCLSMGTSIGNGLTKEAAEFLNLPVRLPVLQGGPDAFVGMIGLGCVRDGTLCLITGSSHLHCAVTSVASRSDGIWGAYRGAPLPHLNFAEGGQSSTGSILRWAKRELFGGDSTYQDLDAEASNIPPGSDGLVALETFQGSRTPVTDPSARGALLGLTLSHTRAHVWRALLEAVCYGTRSCMEGLARAGHVVDEIVLSGGVARSPLWLQLHADITNKTVVVCETTDAPLLGCAVLAAVGAGVHPSVEDAVRAMVRKKQRIRPNPRRALIYSDLYDDVYSEVGSAVRPVVHAAVQKLRGGGSPIREESATATTNNINNKEESNSSIVDSDNNKDDNVTVIISPSLLAANWVHMAGEVRRCIDAGATLLHVDIFDGVYISSPHALTFGPKMVKDIRQCFDTDKIQMDLHMCVVKPHRYVRAMAAAGANRFIFQLEATSDVHDAVDLARQIVRSGMDCGVSINPDTDVSDVVPLLNYGYVSLVDVLSVEPGFGGQAFQSKVLSKIRRLVRYRRNNSKKFFSILVDGGINRETASLVREAGADILVAGTFLFQHPQGLAKGVQELIGIQKSNMN